MTWLMTKTGPQRPTLGLFQTAGIIPNTGSQTTFLREKKKISLKSIRTAYGNLTVVLFCLLSKEVCEGPS